MSPLSIFVDASTSWGIGVMIDNCWMAFKLRQGWKILGRNIGWLETVAVELIAHFFNAVDLQGMRVTIHSDNQGTIGTMGKG
jgi:hypothetical protein